MRTRLLQALAPLFFLAGSFALSGCVVVERPANCAGAEWIPGHYGRNGYWHPGHWICHTYHERVVVVQ